MKARQHAVPVKNRTTCLNQWLFQYGCILQRIDNGRRYIDQRVRCQYASDSYSSLTKFDTFNSCQWAQHHMFTYHSCLDVAICCSVFLDSSLLVNQFDMLYQINNYCYFWEKALVYLLALILVKSRSSYYFSSYEQHHRVYSKVHYAWRLDWMWSHSYEVSIA